MFEKLFTLPATIAKHESRADGGGTSSVFGLPRGGWGCHTHASRSGSLPVGRCPQNWRNSYQKDFG
jgi:hypothetical protein